jgi:hypothetical protein
MSNFEILAADDLSSEEEDDDDDDESPLENAEVCKGKIL